jgi:hypothetical protein
MSQFVDESVVDELESEGFLKRIDVKTTSDRLTGTIKRRCHDLKN